jgi:hypothetical protein
MIKFGEKIRMQRNKIRTTIATLMTLVLVMTIVSSFAPAALIVPVANAEQIDSFAYVAVVPKTAGVSQTILVTGWTAPIPANTYGWKTPGTADDRYKTDYMLTFTKPDGSQDTKNPLAGTLAVPGKSYADGSFFTTYVPDQTGEWSVVLTWAGDENYLPATSEPFKFKVQSEPVDTSYPNIPIPEDYWTRPVPGDIRGIGTQGNLASWTRPGYDAGDSYFNPYSKAPDSAHVLWTYQSWIGGIIGGEYGDLSAADAYAVGKNTGPIVMQGILYETYPRSNIVTAIDIKTADHYTSDISPAQTLKLDSTEEYITSYMKDFQAKSTFTMDTTEKLSA